MRRLNRARVESAIAAVMTTSFECGAWDRNESDEEYDTVWARSERATARLRKMLEPYIAGSQKAKA